MNNKTIKFTIDLDAQIKSFEEKLNTIKNGMNNIGNKEAFSGMEKTLTEAYKQLEKIRHLAAQSPKVSVFEGMGKSATNIGVELDKLKSLVSEIFTTKNNEKISLLPEKEIENIEKATDAIAKFDAAVEKSKEKTKEHRDAEVRLR